ncbi:MAG: winged helix-turn-helix domain-containing protein [Gammaproteobacteria bacterium]
MEIHVSWQQALFEGLAMLTLDDIIDVPEGREIKRAIAVKMNALGFKTTDICDALGVSDSFVSKWKTIYESEGANALRLNYKGGTGFLIDFQRQEIICFIRNKPHYSVEDLRDFIETRYGVVYQSKQSYYDLLKEAGLSWHRTQAVNPRRDEDGVLLKREEIKKNWRPIAQQ